MSSGKSDFNYMEYLKNPWICAGIVSILSFFIYSNNYISKKNIRERIGINSQRTMNLKSAIYVFIVVCITLFIFRYANLEYDESKSIPMLGGFPPF